MSRYSILKRGGGYVLIGVVVVVVVGGVLGQPLLISFVETGSMQPSLDPGDGFVALPTALTGPPETGDVVVFEAEKLHGGGLVTHRIVDRSEEGYITKGDANPAIDQQSGEPPVNEVQVVAVALQVGGQVVSIPYLGTVKQTLRSVQRATFRTLGLGDSGGVQQLAYLFFVASIIWYGIGEWRANERRRRSHDRQPGDGISGRTVVLGLTILVVLAVTVPMVVPAGSQKFGVVSAEFSSNDPTVIYRGTSKDLTYTVPNSGFVPVVVLFEEQTSGVDIEPQQLTIGARDRVNATVTLSAPLQTGYYRQYLVEHRYLALLPLPVIRALYQFHPWAPIVAIDLLVGLSFYLVGVRLLGDGRIRRRSRELKRPQSLSARVRQFFGS